ncbi:MULTISPECIES: hypothetical protein [unclassified Bradyrhizobium]|uniref:hypothetical protein n=1 Tax=unclassified Bradyrhizobium TaxID=2631580 RepID=UPI0024B0F078|nr:hypothetical protein [Bradyrhizobium sp. CB2312]WFU72989.1 hypothetical protein QA642_02600 [Bradyrhizobium sp. CB2312]
MKCYLQKMNLVSRTLEIDADTDARLREIASERGKDVATVLAEAVALLDSVIDLSGPDLAEDRGRYEEFKRTGLAVPLDDVKAWVASWGSVNELPRPQPRKIR